jgi:hypothetical protein
MGALAIRGIGRRSDGWLLKALWQHPTDLTAAPTLRLDDRLTRRALYFAPPWRATSRNPGMRLPSLEPSESLTYAGSRRPASANVDLRARSLGGLILP